MRQFLKQTAITSDSKPSFGGVFALYDSIGLPIEMIIRQFNNYDLQINWLSFKEDALKAGWTSETIKSRLYEGVLIEYGPEYLKEFKYRFELLR